MEQDLEQIRQLLNLFDEREAQKVATNRKIVGTLNDTLLTALYELFGLPHENVVWEDMYMIENVLVLRVGVEYDPTEPMTPFLEYISSGYTSATVKVSRTLQLGIPLTVVFKSKGEIAEWFMKLAVDSFPQAGVVPMAIDPAAPVEAPQTNFDPTALTREQAAQLLYFQALTKETKQ